MAAAGMAGGMAASSAAGDTRTSGDTKISGDRRTSEDRRTFGDMSTFGDRRISVAAGGLDGLDCSDA